MSVFSKNVAFCLLTSSLLFLNSCASLFHFLDGPSSIPFKTEERLIPGEKSDSKEILQGKVLDVDTAKKPFVLNIQVNKGLSGQVGVCKTETYSRNIYYAIAGILGTGYLALLVSGAVSNSNPVVTGISVPVIMIGDVIAALAFVPPVKEELACVDEVRINDGSMTFLSNKTVSVSFKNINWSASSKTDNNGKALLFLNNLPSELSELVDKPEMLLKSENLEGTLELSFLNWSQIKEILEQK